MTPATRDELWTRRRFLAGLAGAGALALVGSAPRRIQVGLAVDPGDAAALRGARLGAEEAGRTAELLGARFELLTASPAEAGALVEPGVLALVGPDISVFQNLPERAGVLLLTLRPAGEEPLLSQVFHVASSARTRRTALERWRSGRPAPAPAGLRAADWHPSLRRFGAEQLNARFAARFQEPMDETAWAAWMAVMIAAGAALRHPGAAPGELPARLERMRFDGHKGSPLRFRPDSHELVQPLYLVAGEEVLGEVSPEEEEG